ncbi:MAG TPA: signal peptidase II [Bacteroidota bacterium]|nr:signal peptidase II [Bacteroidota bacterium]
MTFSQRIILVMTVLLATIGFDQLTKMLAALHLASSPPISFLNDLVRLQYAENSGIMLSLGSTLPEWVRFWLFTVVVGILLFILLLYTLFDRSLDRPQMIALSLMTGGGMGNLFDRIVRDGTVIDFLSVGFGDFRTAVFNVADMVVFAGVILMVLHRRSHETDGDKPTDPHTQPPNENTP